MLKQLTTGLLALTFLASPVLAQGTCDEKKLSDTIDRYADQPFSALTWRVLQGKGDPMIDPRGFGDDSYAAQDEWKQLVATLLIDHDGLRDVGYECRIAYPLSVLKRRVGSLGAAHPYVKQWLLAQEQVLNACRDTTTAAELPPPLAIEPAFVNLQKMDRAYQEASIAFYRDKEKAIPLFRAIADSSSQHRAAARYNIANLLVNARQPDAARAEAQAILADPSMASVHSITRALLGYIANQADTAADWTGLIDRAVDTLDQPAAKILASDELKTEYSNALYDIDFVGVRGKDDDWWLDGTLPENPTISKALVDASRQHPMVLWMMAGQSLDQYYKQLPWSLIGAKWEGRTGPYISKALAIRPAAAGISGPALDMLMALSAKPDDASRAALWSAAKSAMAAAQSSCGTAPETAAAGFLLGQATRVSAMAGKYDEAYQELAAVPFKSASAYYDGAVYSMAKYLVGQGNRAEARTLRDKLVTPEFLATVNERNRGITPDNFAGLLSLIADDPKAWKSAVLMDSYPASNVLFNLIPSKLLWDYAADQSFSDEDRATFARAAWTRDYALGRKLTDEHTSLLTTLNPRMGAIGAEVKSEYPAIGPRNLELLTILRSPRHNILVASPDEWGEPTLKTDDFDQLDSYDKNDRNWWCPMEPDRQLGALRRETDEWALGMPNSELYGYSSLKPVIDDKLMAKVQANRDKLLRQNPVVRQIDWKEFDKLSRVGSAPRQLTEAAIRWGMASKGDDGAPEALARAVEATHYGCAWHGTHEAYSKPAQILLTTKFKDTKWAEQTPYWFGCTRDSWDKDGNPITLCTPKTWPRQKALK